MKLLMRFPGGLRKAMTMSWDDGVETDIRLIEIMKAYGLKGAFNLNSGMFAPEGTVYPAGRAQRRMPLSQIMSTFKDSGMEIATHGFTHPMLDKLTPARATYEIIADRHRLEELFGGIIRGHAYPFGNYNDKVIEIMRDCGIAYARTVKSTGNFSLPENPLAWHPTCHHSDGHLMELLDQFLEKSFKGSSAGLFYIWGHSYEFDGHNNWDLIEEFAPKAGGHEDIWYPNNIDVIDYINAFRSLEFSADGRTVRNGTSTDVWFSVRGGGTSDISGLYCIKGGSTVVFCPETRLEAENPD